LLVLRWRRSPEHLRTGGLIQPAIHLANAESLEETDRTQPSNVAGVLGLVKADTNMGLRSEVVDLVGFDFRQQGDETCAVAKVAIV
jgi:hypothetical protein